MNNKQRRKSEQRKFQLRNELWPNCEEYVWDRLSYDGFTTMPKTMPVILKIMDEMTKNKPVSQTYFALWCSTWDNSYVSLTKAKELASFSGFSGERAVTTWSSRMKSLEQLNFIQIKPGKSGPMSHALILNPHLVIRGHQELRTPGLFETSYNALLELALEVGAKDVIEITDEKLADYHATFVREPTPN
ncbi:hypothetical protein [Rhodomicrobium lacus]|uniref:hypothetical protein n=1 Tax=Rhodomicrobium lacus TaxID=2498452 RepID=UPI0026E45282|nr:hypothetical protein [Rhodomicrobium lacus]WKW51440.1 hypothetical protein QMO75_02825 [Rhodomicrobium lacus]